MLRFFVRLIANLVVNHNKMLIGIFIVLIPIGFYLMDEAIKNIKSDYIDLMPDDNLTIKNIRLLEKVLGGLGTIFVMVDDDPNSPETINRKGLEKFTKIYGDKLAKLKQSEFLRISEQASKTAKTKSNNKNDYDKIFNEEYHKLINSIEINNYDTFMSLFKPTVTYVDYRLGSYIRDHLLYMLDTEDLEDLVMTVRRLEQEFASDKEKKEILKNKIEDIIKKYTGDNIGTQNKENSQGYYMSEPRVNPNLIIENIKKTNFPEKLAQILFGHNDQLCMIVVKPSFLPSNTVKTRLLRNQMNEIFNEAQKEFKEGKMRVRYTGGYFLTLEQQEYMLADIGLTFKLAIGGITLVLLIYFSLGMIPKTNRNYFMEIILAIFSRSFFVIFIMVSIIVANIFTFAYAYIVYGYVNIVSGFLRALLTGIGVEFGIQFMSRFREEIRQGHDRHTAIHTAIKETGFASFTSLMTMAAGFFILGLSEFKGFSEFGMIAGAGVILDNLVMYLLVGSLMLLLGNKFIARIRGDSGTSKNLDKEKYERLMNIKFPYPRTILLISIAITLVLGYYGFTHIEFEYNSRKLQVQTQQSLLVDREIEEKFNFSTDPEIIITDNYDDHYHANNYFRGKSKQVLSKYNTIRDVLGFSDLVPPHKQIEDNKYLIDILADRTKAGMQYGVDKDMTKEEKEQFDMIKNMVKVDPPHPKNLPEVMKIRMMGNYYDGLLTTPFYKNGKADKYRIILEDQLKLTENDKNSLGLNVVPQDYVSGDFNVNAPVAGYLTYYTDEEGKKGLRINGYCSTGSFLLKMADLKEINIPNEAYVRPGDVIAIASKNRFSDTPNLRIELLINDKPESPLLHFGIGQHFLSYITPSSSLWDAREIFEYVGQIRNIPLDRRDSNGKQVIVQPAGSHLVFYEIMEMIKTEGTLMFSIVLVIIFLILCIDFRSIRFALIAMTPLLVGIIWMFGIMALLDVRLTYMNIIVLPLLLGTGINNGIFISHRFRRSGSVMLTMATTGKAQLICALNMMVGWGTLIICSFVGLQTMAHLLLIGYACMVVLFWTLMPSLMQLVSGKKFAIDPEFRDGKNKVADLSAH